MTGAEALELRFMCYDLDYEVSIREYMKELLTRLFEEGESFSGKRPFGNSGWEYDIIKPLVEAGAVRGTYFGEGEDRELADHNPEDYAKVLAEMIAAL